MAAPRRGLLTFILGGIFTLLLAWLGQGLFVTRHESHKVASALSKVPPFQDTEAPQTNPVAPKYDFQPIIGAFGWRLGDKAPNTLNFRRTSDGPLLASLNTSQYPPFKEIVISTLDDGTIYQIIATTYGDEMIMNYLEIEKTLTLRYGNPRFPGEGCQEFGSGTNRIQLTRTDYSATVYYVSEPLATIAQAEQKARDVSNAKKNPSRL